MLKLTRRIEQAILLIIGDGVKAMKLAESQCEDDHHHVVRIGLQSEVGLFQRVHAGCATDDESGVLT